MIDLKKTFEFLNAHQLSFEELGILLTIYYRTQKTDINKEAKLYYETNMFYTDTVNKRNVPIKWKDLVENLIAREFIVDYRTPLEKDRDSKEIKLKYLKVSDKFISIFFVNKSDAYNYAISLYPDWVDLGKLGKSPSKLGDKEILSKLFYDEVLEGGSKERFEAFCYITKEMFDYTPQYDEEGNVIGGKPTKYANVKWENYLKIFKQIEEDFLAGDSSSYNSDIC